MSSTRPVVLSCQGCGKRYRSKRAIARACPNCGGALAPPASSSGRNQGLLDPPKHIGAIGDLVFVVGKKNAPDESGCAGISWVILAAPLFAFIIAQGMHGWLDPASPILKSTAFWVSFAISLLFLEPVGFFFSWHEKEAWKAKQLAIYTNGIMYQSGTKIRLSQKAVHFRELKSCSYLGDSDSAQAFDRPFFGILFGKRGRDFKESLDEVLWLTASGMTRIAIKSPERYFVASDLDQFISDANAAAQAT